jgi:ABC-type transport system involved in multi-copper enzyme maturation permease subunit
MFIWGLQATMPVIEIMDAEKEENVIYIVNYDDGNSTYNLGQVIVSMLGQEVLNEESQIHEARLDTDNYNGITADELAYEVKSKNKSPVVLIPANFTSAYNSFNSSFSPSELPKVEVLVLPVDKNFGHIVEDTLWGIVRSYPFTIRDFEKLSIVENYHLTFPDETDVDQVESGMVAFLAVLVSIIGPMAFVATSFAGEREKRTLEGLLVLPITRFNILISKILAATVVVAVFSIINLIGMIMYSSIMKEGLDRGLDIPAFGLDLSISSILIMYVIMFISAFSAIGIGIAAASQAKDVRTAETTYNMIMIMPLALLGFPILIFGIPSNLNPLYLIPWTNIFAIFYKIIYPKTYESQTITNSILLDIVLHFLYLVIFVILSIGFAARKFNRSEL